MPTRYPATYFDGETARPRRIEVVVGPVALALYEGGTTIARWPYETLRRVDGTNRGPAFIEVTPEHGSDARLRIDDAEAVKMLRGVHPNVDARPPANHPAIRKAVMWTVGALGAMAFIIFVAVPALAPQIAAMIPEDREVALGDQVEGMVRRVGLFSKVCDEPEGKAALDKMVDTLTKGMELRIPVRADVVQSPIVNAVALPGGRVLMFMPLIDEADSAEEVAGVLAHEIGHTHNNDPAREMIRSSASAGVIGLFFGDFLGAGVIAGMGEHAANMSYTRDAERNADDFAVRRLAASETSSEPMAGFFRRFREEGGDEGLFGGYFASHPSFAERESKLIAASIGDQAKPILTDDEWQALQGICDGPEATEEDEPEAASD